MKELSAKLLQLGKDIDSMKVDISVGLKKMMDQQKTNECSVPKTSKSSLSPSANEDQSQASHHEDNELEMSIVSESNTIDDNVEDNSPTHPLNSKFPTTQLQHLRHMQGDSQL